MASARIAIHGSLEFFLRRPSPGPLDYEFDRPPSVKDAIESFGVPHPEVDLVLADGRPADLGVGLRPGILLDVHGLDRPAEFAAIPGLIPAPPDPPRFVLDGHLGRLARYLRTLGLDAWYENRAPDALLATISRDEGRILLTRDRGLLKRSIVRLGYLPRDDRPESQLEEVVARYSLHRAARPFSRCVRCNGVLVPVDRAAVLDRLAGQPRTLRYFDSFAECPGCNSVYWPGSHYERMSAILAVVLRTSDSVKAGTMRENRPEAAARTEGKR